MALPSLAATSRLYLPIVEIEFSLAGWGHKQLQRRDILAAESSDTLKDLQQITDQRHQVCENGLKEAFIYNTITPTSERGSEIRSYYPGGLHAGASLGNWSIDLAKSSGGGSNDLWRHY